MADPYQVLGLDSGSSEQEIRQRYLVLVRQFPPDRDPQRFAEIREAYDKLRDPTKRLKTWLFGGPDADSLDAVLDELKRRLRSGKIPTTVLLSVAEEP
ncbi:MAG TPA: J domain-containing protein [Planctomycetes bacterium]|nr:J domain-containing protein [Planctomycetota bacterium]